MAAVALISGINYSWENSTLILFGVPLIGINKIEFMSEQNKENNYGLGHDPISRGYGNKTYTGTITVLYDELAKIMDAAPGRDILDIPPFDIPMILTGSRVGTRKFVAKMVEFTKSGFSSSQGDTKVWVDLPLIVGGIQW